MSVVGIDFGTTNCVIAVAQRGGIDVIANEVSNRLTPCMVSFGEKERYIGEAALTQWLRAIKSTVTGVKRILGKKLTEEDVKAEAKNIGYKLSEKDGRISADVMYCNEQQTFTSEQITGMILHKLKKTAEAAIGQKVNDVVISVPGYWTDSQRRALLDASNIAGLHTLRLFNETAAVALAYGIYKTDLPETDPIKVLFVDIGDSATSVSAVAFQKGQLKMLGSAYDQHLGGRDFDEVLARHFAKEFQTKHKFDVYSNQKAIIRLRQQCEKVKKILSANPEAPLNMDSLMNDIDVRSSMNRTLFEELSAELLERVIIPIKQVLSDSGLTAEQFSSIELVGGGSRLLSVQKRITDLLKRDLSRTLNSEEAVARGCALQCAMLSPVFKVREFTVNDVSPHPIHISWSSDSSDIFQKNNPIPSPKMVTFKRSEIKEDTLAITADYAKDAQLPAGHPTSIGTFAIKNIPQPSSAENPAVVKVKVKLDIHGIFNVEEATLVETLPESSSDKKEEKKDDKKEEKKDEKKDDKKDDKEEEEKKEKKKKVRRTDVSVHSTTSSYTTKELNAVIEEEGRMAAADQLAVETADRKNALESYIYTMRSRLSEDLQAYSTDSERSTLSSLLDAGENWLYGEGEDVTKSVYAGKLAELQKLGDPIVNRLKEAENRPEVTKALLDTIAQYQSELADTSDKYSHIGQAEKDKITTELNAARDWVSQAKIKQEELPKTANPAFLSSEFTFRKNNIEKLAKPILSTPKPKPKPAETPKPADSKPAASSEQPSTPGQTEPSSPAPPPSSDVPSEGSSMDVD
eukprot:TRINITY_DN362_c0_g1_i2.p1 TRINITY_DN362_c0_g1~~TRINITY_DN362_c0_g1_i2.p1  ORF type:complete len:802 (-),score=310.35 TRINITY_DN362_c0_g1_i2:32-2437(-)